MPRSPLFFLLASLSRWDRVPDGRHGRGRVSSNEQTREPVKTKSLRQASTRADSLVVLRARSDQTKSDVNTSRRSRKKVFRSSFAGFFRQPCSLLYSRRASSAMPKTELERRCRSALFVSCDAARAHARSASRCRDEHTWSMLRH